MKICQLIWWKAIKLEMSKEKCPPYYTKEAATCNTVSIFPTQWCDNRKQHWNSKREKEL